MLRLDQSKENLAEVFGVQKADADRLYRIAKGFHHGNTLVVSRILQRLWIDECISDNIKCWAIFELGRWYGHYESLERREE